MFGIPRARLLTYGLLGGVALGVVCWWPAPRDPYDATLTKAWHQQTVAHRAALARARQAAVTTRVVYVTKRRAALDAVEALPPAQLAGDTLTIPAGTFTVPHPVALYVAQLQHAVATIPPVVSAADTALLAADAVDSAAKVVDHDQTTENNALTAEVKRSRVGRLWDRVKVPGAFVLGAWIGAKVTR